LESAVRKGETEMSAAKLDVPMCFEMLYESDIWIDDSGTSSHSTNYKTGAVNERQFGSASLGHTGEAVKATSTIDVLGQFVTRDGTLGLKAT
jgi:hypothetical protein